MKRQLSKSWWSIMRKGQFGAPLKDRQIFPSRSIADRAADERTKKTGQKHRAIRSYKIFS